MLASQIKKFLLPTLLSISSLSFSSAFAAEGLSYHLSPVPATQSVDFTLKDMDDNTHRLKDYHGKVVMINFWATWCPPCRKEMPSMEVLYQKFKDKGFTILAINQWEDIDRVFMFSADLDTPPTFPILFDQKGSVSEQFGVQGLPTTLVLNKKGQVVYRAVGGRDFNHPEVEKIIRSLLDK